MIFTSTLLKTNFHANLLFSDTDSLTYEIKSKYIYEEFLKYTCLTLVNFTQTFLIQLTKKLLAK